MFSCSFFDDDKKTQWFLCYNPGFIQIECHGGVNLQLNFPPDEEGEYDTGSNHRNGGQNIWGDLKTRGFTLRACTRTYMEDETDPGVQPHPSGDVEVDFHATGYSGGHYMRFDVPYLLARGLMKLMCGQYDLEGAVHVQIA